MLSYAKIYADELAELCAPGETAVDAISVMYNSGLEQHPDETNAMTFDPLNGLSVDSWDDAATSAIGGLTLDVRRGHLAGELAEAAASASVHLAVTSQRILVVDGLSGGADPRNVWSSALGDVAVLRHDPRLPLEVGRMLVGFTDGSLVRLWAGIFLPFTARRFAASFASAAHR